MSESSPRWFANQGLVYLSEIENIADIQDLSVKQAKDILAMNRVNFKGVVEKDELLKHVSRLWKQEKQAQEGKDLFKTSTPQGIWDNWDPDNWDPDNWDLYF